MTGDRIVIVYTDEVGSSSRHEATTADQVLASTAEHFAGVVRAASAGGVRVIKNVGDSLVLRCKPNAVVGLLSNFAELKCTVRTIRIGMHCAPLERLVIDDRVKELVKKLEEIAGATISDVWPEYKSHLANDIFGHEMNFAARIAGIPHGDLFVISQSLYNVVVDQMILEKGLDRLESARVLVSNPNLLNEMLLEHGIQVSLPNPIVRLKGLRSVEMSNPAFVYEVRHLAKDDTKEKQPLTFSLRHEQKEYRSLYAISLHSGELSESKGLRALRARYAGLKLLRTELRPALEGNGPIVPHPATAFIDLAFDIYGLCEVDIGAHARTTTTRPRSATALTDDAATEAEAKRTVDSALGSERLFWRTSGAIPCFLLMCSFPDAQTEAAFRRFLDLSQDEGEGTVSSLVRSFPVWNRSLFIKDPIPPPSTRLPRQLNKGDSRFEDRYQSSLMSRVRNGKANQSSADHILLVFRMNARAGQAATDMSAAFQRMTISDLRMFGGPLVSCGLLRGAWDGYLLYRYNPSDCSYLEAVEKIISLSSNMYSMVHNTMDLVQVYFLGVLFWDEYLRANLDVLSASTEEHHLDLLNVVLRAVGQPR